MSSRVGIQQFVSATEPTGTQIGDEWFNSATNLLYKRTMIGGTLGWAILGTANTTGTAGQVLGVSSTGALAFTTPCVPVINPATPAASGTLLGYTTSYGNTALGCCAGNTSMTGCNNIAVGCSSLLTINSGCNNIALGACAMCRVTGGSNNIALGTNSLCRVSSGNGNIGIGYATNLVCNGSCNISIGFQAGGTNYGASNIAIGANSMIFGAYGCFNTAVGYGSMNWARCAKANVSLGYTALCNVCCGCCNIAIGACAGTGICNGNFNVVIGNFPSTFGVGSNNVVLADGAGNVRMSFTSTGAMSVGTTLFNWGSSGQVLTSSGPSAAPTWAAAGGGGAAAGGSGLFNTSISNQVGYALTDRLFDLTGSAGTYTNLTTIVVGTTATNGVAAVMPSTTGTRYVVHSIHITNTAASDAEVTGRFDHTQGFGGTATIQGSLIDHTSLFASRLPVPSGSAVELIKKPQVLNPNDWIRLQSTTAAGGSGINGALTAFIVYESSTDWTYTGVGINLASTSPTNVYISALNTTTNTVTATNYPSVIESVRVTNYSNAADYRVTVPWTNSVGTVQSYLAYNMLIPAFATVELLEKPKRITSGDIIKAIPEAPNVLSIQVSGKLITSTFV